MVLYLGYFFNYFIVAFYLSSIPGNKFINGIIFGAGIFTFIFLSGKILKALGDLKAFYLALAFCAISQTTIVLFPQPGIHIYFAVLANVGMLGAWLNISLCIIECRVHPQLYGQTALICMCAGSVASTMAPNIAHLPEPYPMIISLGTTCVAFFATFLLPPPGMHLTSKENIEKAVTEGSKAGLVPEVSLLVNYQL